MIAKEPKNELLICKALMTLIAQRRGERIISAQPVDRHSIANATIAEISARDDAPDIVVWARTSTNPWKAWFLKDGDATHPNVSMAGPYALHPDAYPPSVALQRRIK